MKRKSTAQLIREYLDEHLLATNMHLAGAIGRTPADVSSVTNRLYKAGVLIRLHADFSATHLYALWENRHVARLSVRVTNTEYRTRTLDY